MKRKYLLFLILILICPLFIKEVKAESYTCHYEGEYEFEINVTNGTPKLDFEVPSDKVLYDPLLEWFENGNCSTVHVCDYGSYMSISTNSPHPNADPNGELCKEYTYNAKTNYHGEGGSSTDDPDEPSTDDDDEEEYIIDYNSICSDKNIKKGVRIIGIVLYIIKILVPLIIIVLGMIDFAKAVISSDDNALKKSTSSLIKRCIAGVIVFFIPSIIMAALGLLEITNGIEDDTNTQFGMCTKCLFDPFGKCVGNSSNNNNNNVGGGGSSDSYYEQFDK